MNTDEIKFIFCLMVLDNFESSNSNAASLHLQYNIKIAVEASRQKKKATEYKKKTIQKPTT